MYMYVMSIPRSLNIFARACQPMHRSGYAARYAPVAGSFRQALTTHDNQSDFQIKRYQIQHERAHQNAAAHDISHYSCLIIIHLNKNELY